MTRTQITIPDTNQDTFDQYISKLELHGNPSMQDIKVLERYKNGFPWRISFNYKLPSMMAKRQGFVELKKVPLRDGKIMYLVTSFTNDDDYPEIDKIIRMKIWKGYVTEEMEDGSLSIGILQQLNLYGKIPKVIANKLVKHSIKKEVN
jgi:hypothetical protein